LAKWVRVCGLAEAPTSGGVRAVEAEGTAICLANVGGEFAALNDLCPHAGGSLATGWVQGEAVVCPLHSLPFNVKTGEAERLMKARVDVYPVKVKGDDVLVNLDLRAGGLVGWISRITQ